MNKPIKQKKCKNCKELFTPFTSLAKACSVICAYALVKQDKDKKYKKETLGMKKKFKDNDRSGWLDKAQKSCNAYIRERDKDLPCISCGTTKPDIQYCAGHFKTRGGHPELRFNPLNLHKQCNHHCNMQLSGNISGYRPRLIEKIGIDKVEWLEGEQQAQNWTIIDLKEICQYYKDKLKELSHD